MFLVKFSMIMYLVHTKVLTVKLMCLAPICYIATYVATYLHVCIN